MIARIDDEEIPVNAARPVDHEASGPALDADLATNVERQRQEVDALESSLPPEEQAEAAADIQAARNAHSTGHAADPSVITRITQRRGDKEVGDMLKLAGGGALGLSGLIGGMQHVENDAHFRSLDHGIGGLGESRQKEAMPLPDFN